MCESSVSILNRHPRIYHTPLVMNHALLLSLICGRGDVVTRSILRLSADAYEMQLCEQGLARHARWQATSQKLALPGGSSVTLALVARSERFELPTLGFEVRCSIQLSYERASLSRKPFCVSFFA